MKTYTKRSLTGLFVLQLGLMVVLLQSITAQDASGDPEIIVNGLTCVEVGWCTGEPCIIPSDATSGKCSRKHCKSCSCNWPDPDTLMKRSITKECKEIPKGGKIE